MNSASLVGLLALLFTPLPLTGTTTPVNPGEKVIITFSLPNIPDTLFTGITAQLKCVPDTPEMPPLTDVRWMMLDVGTGWRLAQGTGNPYRFATVNYPGQGFGGRFLQFSALVPATAPRGHGYRLEVVKAVLTNDRGEECSDITMLQPPRIEVKSCLPGDMNGDGQVTLADALAVCRYIITADGAGNPCAADAADLNRDGKVDIRDVEAVLQVLVGG
ncbi:MAG TPA: dockerin type I repeat-containing protein [Armatimonadota bacterium]|jgi:hypothetical protein